MQQIIIRLNADNERLRRLLVNAKDDIVKKDEVIANLHKQIETLKRKPIRKRNAKMPKM